MSKKTTKSSNPNIQPVKTTGVPLVEHEAVWQYLLDHSIWTPYGYKIVFWIRNRSEWDWKVDSRMRGVYRIDEKAEEARLEKEATNFFITQKMNNKMGRLITKIEKEGSLYDKFMLWAYRKSRDYIKCQTKTLPDSVNSETSKS